MTEFSMSGTVWTVIQKQLVKEGWAAVGPENAFLPAMVRQEK